MLAGFIRIPRPGEIRQGSLTGEKGEIVGGSRLFAGKGAWLRRVEGLDGFPDLAGRCVTVGGRAPPLGTLHGKIDTSGHKLNRQDAKFAKEDQYEGSEDGFHASLLRFSIRLAWRTWRLGGEYRF